MAQSVDSNMNLGALALLVPVKASPGSALRGGLYSTTVQNDRAGIGLSVQRHPQNGSQVVRHSFKTSRFDPPLRLLIDHTPRRQIIGQHTPGSARPDQITQRIEDLAQRVLPLRRTLFHQRQIVDAETPLFVADIARITFLFFVHPQLNAGMYIHCTDNSYKKLSTGSRSWCAGRITGQLPAVLENCAGATI